MKQKSKNLMWVIVGTILFVLPPFLYPLINNSFDKENFEHRYLTEKPVFGWESYSNFSQQYENYYNDHLPYRNLLVKGMNGIKYFGFHENVGDVICGQEGWLFYAGCNAVNNYKRASFFPEDYMQEVVKNVNQMNKVMDEAGIEFLIVLLPNKEEIYDNYMPEYYLKPEGPNRTDILVNFLHENSDVTLIYPKDELLAYKNDYQLYFKYDTHWNCLGSFIAYEQIEENLHGQREYLEMQKIVRCAMNGRTTGEGDLARMMGLRSYFDYDFEYYVDQYPLLRDWSLREYENKDSKYSDKVLLVGDSFRISLLPYLTKDYNHLVTVGTDEYSAGMLEEYKPDIVVLELLERNDEYLLDWSF